MAARPFPLRVVSVEQSLFEGEAGFLVANGSDGELGILAGHSALLASLRPGALVIKDDVGGPARETLFVGGGFLEVLPDRVTVLADVAERAEDISVEAAEAARKQAADRLQGELTPDEEAVMRAALETAEARLRLARELRRS